VLDLILQITPLELYQARLHFVYICSGSNTYSHIFTTMNINRCGAKYSEIVEIGEKLKAYSKKTGKEILFLNRGIPSVTQIDLSGVIPQINFNSKSLQEYPPNLGIPELREAINKVYFHQQSESSNICITAGGMNALDILLQTLMIDKLMIPRYFWIGYTQVPIIRHFDYSTYTDLKWLDEHAKSLAGCTVMINDPNNPTGAKEDDEKLLDTIAKLDAVGCTVILDCPYRRVFIEAEDDHFFEKVIKYKQVIIVESFSKSYGLSGQRVAFIHTTNKELMTEINLRSLYTNNGVNAFGQQLVNLLLSTEEGIKAGKEFRRITTRDMQLNIEYLKSKKLLAEEFYKDSSPIGIFAILNKSEDDLLKYNIGSVSMKPFTLTESEKHKKFSRICIAVKHDLLKSFFDAIPTT